MCLQPVLSAQDCYRCLRFQFVSDFSIFVGLNVGTNVVNSAQLMVLGDRRDWLLVSWSACLHLTLEGKLELSQTEPPSGTCSLAF